jgi:CheY-like chemotaxis protein
LQKAVYLRILCVNRLPAVNEEGEMKPELPRILVVDDEPDMGWALGNILGPEGFAVVTATSSAEALELLARETYTVAFVDAMLPDLDGIMLSALIRQRSPHTAIILISGYFYAEDRAVAEGLQKGLFIDFIAKPFDLEDIRLKTRQAIERITEVGQ